MKKQLLLSAVGLFSVVGVSLLSALETFYQKKRFKNLAIVLNGTESTGGRYGYRYGYSFGYHNAYTSYYGNK